MFNFESVQQPFGPRQRPFNGQLVPRTGIKPLTPLGPPTGVYGGIRPLNSPGEGLPPLAVLGSTRPIVDPGYSGQTPGIVPPMADNTKLPMAPFAPFDQVQSQNKRKFNGLMTDPVTPFR